MERTHPTLLRLFAGLGVALVLGASSPHLHPADHESNEAATSIASRPERPEAESNAFASISADTNHHEHTSRTLLDVHACSICRAGNGHALDTSKRPPPIDPLEVHARAASGPFDISVLSLVAIHPSRAPPGDSSATA